MVDNGGFVYAGGQYGASEGITLRDDLARKAMPQVIAMMLDREDNYLPPAVAAACYELADAMIAESRVTKAEPEPGPSARAMIQEEADALWTAHPDSEAVKSFLATLVAAGVIEDVLERRQPSKPLGDDDIPF